MKYQIFDDRIEIENSDDFNIMQTLSCGQVFRFKVEDFGFKLYFKGEKATIYCQKNTTKIYCSNPKLMQNYLDLQTDYAKIKADLGGFEILKPAIKFGSGIRILKQDPLEMLISFIISANNNIPRIKSTIEKICEGYGTKKEDYFAFPTLSQLKEIPLEFFRKCGCGYRSEYLVDTISKLENFNLDEIYNLDVVSARKKLMMLKGVGRKVADCVLLFGFSKTEVFPTDTWIEKVYKENYDKEMEAKKVSDFFSSLFGNLSGYAQQYLFYERMSRKNQ